MDTKARSSHRGVIEGRLLAVVLWLIPLAAVGLGVRGWLPPLASQHGLGIDRMISYLLITVGSLFVMGHAALGFFVWRFSTSERVSFRLASTRTEWRWSLIPVLLMALVAEGGVLTLGLPVWKKLYAVGAPPEAVTVELTAEQFVWNVRYPGPDGVFGRTKPTLIRDSNPLGLDSTDPSATDDIVHPGVLYLPVNRPARIRLRSKDTVHSFFLPHFRIKQDAVPGMTIEIGFVPTRVGEYEIACAQLCGLGHYRMRGILRVVPVEDFEKRLSEL